MITSFTLTNQSLICYKTDGSVLLLEGDKIPSSACLAEMTLNIQRDGHTPLLDGALDSAIKIIEGWGYKVLVTENPLVQVGENTIPVKPLSNLLTHATSTENQNPVKALLGHLENVPREHSAQDLVSFLEKSSMPITAHGYILAFKRVHKDVTGTNLDVHSRKVRNNAGDYVHMEEKDVDPSRTSSCSYGLHIASRDYLKTFTGNALVAVLIKPQHVIAVPLNEHTKMRVCAYTVVYEFTEAEMLHILSDEPLNENFWNKVKPFMETDTFTPSWDVSVKNGKPIIKKYTEGNVMEHTPVETTDSYYKEVAVDTTPSATVDALKTITTKNTFRDLLTLFLKAQSLSDRKSRYADLMLFKRKQKKSWSVLGATKEEESTLVKFGDRLK